MSNAFAPVCCRTAPPYANCIVRTRRAKAHFISGKVENAPHTCLCEESAVVDKEPLPLRVRSLRVRPGAHPVCQFASWSTLASGPISDPKIAEMVLFHCVIGASVT